MNRLFNVSCWGVETSKILGSKGKHIYKMCGHKHTRLSIETSEHPGKSPSTTWSGEHCLTLSPAPFPYTYPNRYSLNSSRVGVKNSPIGKLNTLTTYNPLYIIIHHHQLLCDTRVIAASKTLTLNVFISAALLGGIYLCLSLVRHGNQRRRRFFYRLETQVDQLDQTAGCRSQTASESSGY